MTPRAIVALLAVGTLLVWLAVEAYLIVRYRTTESEIIQAAARNNPVLRFGAALAFGVLLDHLLGQP